MNYDELKKELSSGIPYKNFWQDVILKKREVLTIDQLKSQALLYIYAGEINNAKLLCDGYAKTLANNAEDRDLELILLSIRYQAILPDDLFAEQIINSFTSIELSQIIYETIMSWGFNKSLIKFFIAIIANKNGVIALQLLFQGNKRVNLENVAGFTFIVNF